MEKILLYSSIPAFFMIVGSIISWYNQPSDKISSIIQHFAAGVVLSAVSTELIPKIIQNENQWLICLGFAIGVIVMLFVEQYSDYLNDNLKSISFPLGLMLAVIIDVFIDGILIGVSYAANIKSGIIITLALTLEVFFLGMASTASLIKSNNKQFIGIIYILFASILIIVGALLGYLISSNSSTILHILIIAFSAAALLYLVFEELFVEAHKVRETKMATLAFFMGFLIILLIV